MNIKNHRLVDVNYKPAKAIGGKITPTIIVVHDTASRLTKFAAMNYLRNNSRKVSVHFTVERDGTITQSVPTNRRANHAGRSSYNGRRSCNNFSIGIEIVSPGIMTKGTPGHSRTWYGEEFDIDEHGIQRVSTKNHGAGYWMPYTPEQIESVEKICEACVTKYNIIDIVAHWFVSPGRKVDTNPLFPLAKIKTRVMGREEDTLDTATEDTSSDTMVTINAPGDRLSMREWPSFNPNVITSIPHGTEVPLLSTGTFNGRKWHKVMYDSREGWVVARYTKE